MTGRKYFYDFIPIHVEATEEEKEQILSQYPVPEMPELELFFNLDNETKGNNVSVRLLLNEVNVQTTKTNKQFLKMTFSNNAGMINAKMWDNQGAVEKNKPILDAYSVFDVEGVVDEFRGFKSLTINKITPLANKSKLIKITPKNKSIDFPLPATANCGTM